MDRLEQIKNEVCQEWGHTDWNDFWESFKNRIESAHAERDEVITEIARRYATEVARHNLEKQHECIRNLIRIYHNTDEDELKAIITNIVNTWMKAGD